MSSHTLPRVIRHSGWDICGCLIVLVMLLGVFSLCANFVQNTLYTLCLGTLAALLLGLTIYGLANGRKYRFVFERDVAVAHTHTEISVPVEYEDVESIRFSYSIGFDGVSPHIIAIRMKNVPNNLPPANTTKGFWNDPPNSILWDVTHFSMETISRVLIELCERTSVPSIVIHFPQYVPSDPDPQLCRALKRRGQLERDEASQDFIFTPFRTSVC